MVSCPSIVIRIEGNTSITTPISDWRGVEEDELKVERQRGSGEGEEEKEMQGRSIKRRLR